MNQLERLTYLIDYLKAETPRYKTLRIPEAIDEQKKVLRAMMNVRKPAPVSKEFLRIQDEYLKEEVTARGIVELSSLTPREGTLYLWKGDMTRLAVDAIVNAANSELLGCFIPCHSCIDNAIHSFAGVSLRLLCNDLMVKQGAPEPLGQAKITPAYNLPAKYVIHTVGPRVGFEVTEGQKDALSGCYRSSLELAHQFGADSIAFCCISTDVYRFPNDLAAEIAIRTVKDFLSEHASSLKVVFNVYKDIDFRIYDELLGKSQPRA